MSEIPSWRPDDTPSEQEARMDAIFDRFSDWIWDETNGYNRYVSDLYLNEEDGAIVICLRHELPASLALPTEWEGIRVKRIEGLDQIHLLARDDSEGPTT